MSAQPQPLPVHAFGGQPSRQDRDVTMEASKSKSKRASLDRQTRLAHLKLVSKYYGHSNYSYPRPGSAASHNPYRRAGHSYLEPHDHAAKPESCEQQQASPSGRGRRTSSRNFGRTSVDSQGSAPSLIDDHTDSELSHDDEYLYHASTSQLWDSFWAAQEYAEGAKPHWHAQQDGPAQHHNYYEAESQSTTPKKPQGGPAPRYPALIPSPHIRRTKRTAKVIKSDEEPMPHAAVEYVVPASPLINLEASKKQSPPQWPIRTTNGNTATAAAKSAEETRKTIRAAKSSYGLFPKQPILNSSNIGAITATTLPRPAPRSSSLQRPETPLPPTPAQATNTQQKTSRPQPIQHNSDPLPSAAAAPQQTQRPHTSHGMAQPSTSSGGLNYASHSPHVSDPSSVMTTLPMFPSSNLADLSHPRSAPRPPNHRCEAPLPRPPPPSPPPMTSATTASAMAPPLRVSSKEHPFNPWSSPRYPPPAFPAPPHIASQYSPPRRVPPPVPGQPRPQPHSRRPATSAATTTTTTTRPSEDPPSNPTFAHQKSFFDFDSDSESEPESPGRGGGGRISRIMKGRRHKHRRDSVMGSSNFNASFGASVPGSSLDDGHSAAVRGATVNGEREQGRRRRRGGLGMGKKAGGSEGDGRAEERRSRNATRKNEGVVGGAAGGGGRRKADVLGRMFGRKTD